MDTFDQRLTKLEEAVFSQRLDMNEIKNTLKSLATSAEIASLRAEVTEVKGRVSALPSGESYGALKADVGELKGRVYRLPGTPTIGIMISIGVAIIGIIERWPSISAALFGTPLTTP